MFGRLAWVVDANATNRKMKEHRRDLSIGCSRVGVALGMDWRTAKTSKPNMITNGIVGTPVNACLTAPKNLRLACYSVSISVAVLLLERIHQFSH